MKTKEYTQCLEYHLKKGWQIVSEIPTGAQLRKPKSLDPVSAILILVGIPAIFLWGLGLLLILLGILNYAMHKEETKFIPVDGPFEEQEIAKSWSGYNSGPAIASLIVPGLGQFLQGRRKAGICFLACYLIFFLLGGLGLLGFWWAFHIAACIHAAVWDPEKELH